MTDQTRQAPIQFRGLEKELDRRGEQRGMIAKRDLQRYYKLLRDALHKIILRENEALFLCEICHPSRWDPHSAPYLWDVVNTAIKQEKLDVKRNVDGRKIIFWLEHGTVASLAIADAAEQFWYLKEKGDIREDNELLVEVGLLKKVVL